MRTAPVPEALLACEAITRRRARNFWYGIRLLPAPKRRALAAVYALARRIDDIGDGAGRRGPAERREALARLEAQLGRLDPGSPDPVLAGVALAADRFPLPVGAFADLIEGVRMDLDGTAYATFEDLVGYCRRVAGSVGRLSLAVFGAPGTAAGGRAGEAVADDLGVAMQLTNVLRDVREDLGRGRVYLPAEDLARFGLHPTDLAATAGGPAVSGLVRLEAERAEDWFARGLRLVPLLDRRSAACVAAMSGIYRRLLARIESGPEAVLRGRVSLPGWEKALVAVWAVGGADPGPRSGARAPGLRGAAA